MIRVLLFVAVWMVSCAHKGPNVGGQAPQAYKSAAEMPVEAFFGNPVLARYQISNDGKTLAVLKPWKNRMNIFIHPVGKPSEVTQLTFVTDRDIRNFSWKGSSFILYSRDVGGDENFHVYAIDVQTRKVRDLLPFEGARTLIVSMLAESSSTDVLLINNNRNKEIMDLYRVNVQTGESKLVYQNDLNIGEWLIDHAGAFRGGTATDGVNSVFYYRKTESEPLKALVKTNFRNSFSPVAFDKDNKNIYAISNLKRNFLTLVEVNPDLPPSQMEVRKVYAHPKFDIGEVGYSLARKNIGYIEVVTEKREYHFLNPDDKKSYEQLQSLYPNFVVAFGNQSNDERYWVVRTFSDVDPGSYVLFDRDTNKATHLGALFPQINPDLMSEMKPVTFKARDGLTIPGYLTLPKGKAHKNMPMVLNVHGGPWARDEWYFNPEVQLLASRGFAVLQVNYRGSTGYGRKYWEASFKEWGRKMQNDLTDSVQWAIRQNYADPKRVCIYGGSYGGYATLAGVTFTPDLYSCAIDYVGVSNLMTFMKTIPPYWKPYLEMFYEMVGHPEKEKKMMMERSPVFHADKIKTPLFVAQGANDPRVNKAESDQIVEALKKRGVDVEYMVKNNEGHGFHNEENRFDFYKAMLKFLAKHDRGAEKVEANQ